MQENLLIKGDSIKELPKLIKEYKNSIKMIYIDPPYNTERKDMTYNDNRNDEDFLNLLSKTLSSSYELLREDGVIFVSISAHKMHVVRTELEKIYKKENYAATMIRMENAKKQKIGSASLKENYEYIISFYKNKNKKSLNYIKNEKYISFSNQIKKLYNSITNDDYIEDYIMIKTDKISKKQLQSLKTIWSLQEQSQGLKQYKYFDIKKSIPFRAADINMYLGKGNYFDIIHPITRIVCKKPKYGYPDIKKIEGDYTLIPGQNKYEYTGNIIQISDSKILCGNLIYGLNENKIPDFKNELDTFSHPDTIINITGSEDRYLTKLFKGIKVFDYPKPLKLIDYLLDISTKEGDFVLDFFAGSGTTAESSFNKNRKFILIQYPEIIKIETKEKLIKKDFKNIDTIYDITKKRLELTNVDFKEKG